MGHTSHPDSHHSGLADGCPRCESHAQNLLSLDADNLLRIWSGTIITRTDMVAYNNLYRAVNQSLGLLSAIDRIEDETAGKFEMVRDMFYDHGGKA